MGLIELTTKITFNELIKELNNNFDVLSSNDQDLSKELTNFTTNKYISSLSRGKLEIKDAKIEGAEFKIGSTDQQILLNSDGVAISLGNQSYCGCYLKTV